MLDLLKGIGNTAGAEGMTFLTVFDEPSCPEELL